MNARACKRTLRALLRVIVSCCFINCTFGAHAHAMCSAVHAKSVVAPVSKVLLVDSALEQWEALAKGWSNSSGAANCKVTVAVQDGDLASDRSAALSVIAWDAVENKFALTQNSLTVLIDFKRLRAMQMGGDAAVDRAVTMDPVILFRSEISESPWPQLSMALRNQSEVWWKNIDPELGEVALKSCVKKDDGTMIVMLEGKNGSLELVFNGGTFTLFAATRRIESGPRVPKNAAIEWRMTFESIDIPAGMLTVDVGDRRRVERLDDLRVGVANKEPPKQARPSMPGIPEVKPDSKPQAAPEVKPDSKPQAAPEVKPYE